MAVPTTARFAQLLRRAFSVKGPIDPSLLEDFFPDLSSLLGFVMPDQQRMRGEFLWCISQVISSGAATRPFINLTTPSGVLGVVTGMIATPSISDVIQWGYGGTGGPAGNPGTGSDVRALPNVNSATNFGTGAQAGDRVVAFLGRVQVIAQTGLFIPLSVMFDSRQQFCVQTQGPNETLVVWITGYERSIEPSENF